MTGLRRLPEEPKELPLNLSHGESYAYRRYKCRCELCLEWRRSYDRDYSETREKDPEKLAKLRRARQDRADEQREERRLAHSIVLWAYTIESEPNDDREAYAVRATVNEEGYLLPAVRNSVRRSAMQTFGKICPGCRIGRQGWRKEVMHIDELKEEK